MKTLNAQYFATNFKINKHFALEIVYSNFFESKIIRTDRGNYAASTINYLKKKFNAVFSEVQNDAPKGGKRGNFVKMLSADPSFEVFQNAVIAEDDRIIFESEKRKQLQNEAVQNMIISEEEKRKFLEKTTNFSNSQRRKTAHNYAAKKLGFYSTAGMDKFYDLQ